MLACCVGAISCSKSGQKKKDINVILISIDTLRADHLNCYGYEGRVVSPNIDALARDGILFENFITASPWTMPAHFSMLTSLSPSAHGMNASFQGIIYKFRHGHKFNRLPYSRVMLAEVLREYGYATGAFTGGGPVDPRLGFDQGFDIYKTAMFKLNDNNVGEMDSWRKQQKRRFFLFWHHFEVHAPYLHADFVADSLPSDTARALRDELKKIQLIPEKDLWPAGAREIRYEEIKKLRHFNVYNRDVCETLYAGAVLSSDRWTGRLIESLKAEGLYDSSLIVLTSDHGEEFGDHRETNYYNMHGHSLYEEMVHVPLIIKLPKQKHAGKRVATVGQTVDIMPTILDILSLTPKQTEMQGTSLRHLWESPSTARARTAFSEALATVNEKKGVRTSRYKYIVSVSREQVYKHGRAFIPKDPTKRELYDLRKDPKEKSNLLKGTHSTNFDKLAADLERQLRDFVPEENAKAEPVDLDPSALERLKALGYIDN